MFIRLIIGGLRTLSTFTLAMILVLNLVILVATSVAFNFITKPNLPAAISEDLDVTGRMHSVTSQVMQVVPLKSLEKLEPLVGKNARYR